MSGDFEYDQAAKLIHENWADLKPAESFPQREKVVLQPITTPVIKEVSGPDRDMIAIAWRLDGAKSEDEKLATLLSQLLSNGKAGLIDLDLVQQQKLLEASAGADFMKEYGYLQVFATLREGQSMEEARDLVLSEIEKIKQGNFDTTTFKAIINNLRKGEIEKRENNWRAFDLVSAFVEEREWVDKMTFVDELEKITREDIIAFANKKFNNNYVAVFKRNGEDTSAVKVDKPTITPLKLNKDVESQWLQAFNATKAPEIQPVFIDFEKDIQKSTVADKVPFYYIKNADNELFSLYYILEMGSAHDRELSLAIEYLPFLGTDKYSPEELRREIYKNGLDLEVVSSENTTYIYVSGLKKSTEKGIELLEHLLNNAKANAEVYAEFVQGELKKREDAKKNKNIMTYRAMPLYAKHGLKNPFSDILSAEILKNMNPEILTGKIKDALKYKHLIHYYGQEEPEQIRTLLEKYHAVSENLAELPVKTEYPELEQPENTVYFVHRDQVQAELMLISKDVKFNKDLLPWASLYNNYYGSGLSSIVFQEIREAKALAYSAYSSFSTPAYSDQSHYTTFYVGTQADKFHDAWKAVQEIMSEMPKVENQFEATKLSARKIIASDRKIKSSKFFYFLNNKRLGIDYDQRKDAYALAQTATLNELEAFFNAHIRGKNYTLMVLADKTKLSPASLSKYGKVREITAKDLFGY
jgi:predicted Zn-dependent peptidase